MKVRLTGSSRSSTEIRFHTQQTADDVPDFKGDVSEVAVRYEARRTVVHVGLGDPEEVSERIVRSAAAVGIRRVAGLKRASAMMDLRGIESSHEAAVDGALLGSYAFDKYLTEKQPRLRTLEVVSGRLKAADVRRRVAISEGVALARDLVNDNGEVVTPEYLARQARALRRTPDVRVTILGEAELRKQGLNLLTAVGRGSPWPSRLILTEYRGASRTAPTVAIIGKGITFDAGGLNLKPSGHIETMRIDMAGAAAVLGTMKALVELRPKINVIGVCAAACNVVDGTSVLPGDVIRSYSGKTVEICNTDAEGRLALADAISYVRAKHRPTHIVDLATLTGGVLVTFADVVAGLFSNDDSLADGLFAAGETTNERLWRLPLYKEYSDAMKGDRSDVRNLPKFKRGHASSLTGAAFLMEFVGDTPWAHIDIAGTAFNEGEARGEIPKYATGYGVRLLTHFLLSGGFKKSR